MFVLSGISYAGLRLEGVDGLGWVGLGWVVRSPRGREVGHYQLIE